MKTRSISTLLFLAILFSSCKSELRIGESINVPVYSICKIENAQLLLNIKFAFAWVPEQEWTVCFPCEYGEFKSKNRFSNSWFLNDVSPVSMFWLCGPLSRTDFKDATVTGVVVAVQCRQPGGTNLLRRELNIPWRLSSGASNETFWYRAEWKQLAPQRKIATDKPIPEHFRIFMAKMVDWIDHSETATFPESNDLIQIDDESFKSFKDGKYQRFTFWLCSPAHDNGKWKIVLTEAQMRKITSGAMTSLRLWMCKDALCGNGFTDKDGKCSKCDWKGQI